MPPDNPALRAIRPVQHSCAVLPLRRLDENTRVETTLFVSRMPILWRRILAAGEACAMRIPRQWVCKERTSEPRPQVSQCVHGHRYFGAFLAFGSVAASTLTALGRGWERAAVDDHGGGIFVTSFCPSQSLPQIPHHGFKDSGRCPTPALLINGIPWWKVVGQVSPRRSGSHEPPQSIQYRAEVMLPLGRVFAHQRQIRQYE